MSANTKIEWADHTFNPWEGCQKVGPGCDHCYAESRNARFAGGVAVNWGPGAPRRLTSESNWQEPRKWDREAKAKGIRYRVFCASLADVFDNAVDPWWRSELFILISETPNLDWLLLTKRIGNVNAMLPVWYQDPSAWKFGNGVAYHNVWIGATIVNQEEADRDIPKLLAVPAAKRFLSMEPLLGPVDLSLPTRLFMTGRGPYGKSEPIATCDHCCNGDRCDDPTHCERGRPDWRVKCRHCRGTGEGKPIDWVIVGGESGPNARPMHPDWARSLRDQCQAARVPFLFKQWGEWEQVQYLDRKTEAPLIRIAGPDKNVILMEPGPINMRRVGKKAAGRLLDGCTWDEVPAS